MVLHDINGSDKVLNDHNYIGEGPGLTSFCPLFIKMPNGTDKNDKKRLGFKHIAHAARVAPAPSNWELLDPSLNLKSSLKGKKKKQTLKNSLET